MNNDLLLFILKERCSNPEQGEMLLRLSKIENGEERKVEEYKPEKWWTIWKGVLMVMMMMDFGVVWRRWFFKMCGWEERRRENRRHVRETEVSLSESWMGYYWWEWENGNGKEKKVRYLHHGVVSMVFVVWRVWYLFTAIPATIVSLSASAYSVCEVPVRDTTVVDLRNRYICVWANERNILNYKIIKYK